MPTPQPGFAANSTSVNDVSIVKCRTIFKSLKSPELCNLKSVVHPKGKDFTLRIFSEKCTSTYCLRRFWWALQLLSRLQVYLKSGGYDPIAQWAQEILEAIVMAARLMRDVLRTAVLA